MSVCYILVAETGKMTPSNEFLKSINLSTEIYELLLEKLNNSVDQLQDILDIRNRLIIYNKELPETTKNLYGKYYGSKASDHNFVIRNRLAEVRFYRGYLHTISLLEASYEKERRRDW